MRELKNMERLEPLTKRPTRLVQGLLGLAFLLFPQQGHALSLTVDSATVGVGTTFTLNLNVTDAVNLTAWQLDLAYNPAILQANSVAEGPFLVSTGGPTSFSAGIIDNTSGLISLVTNSYNGLTPPTGSGVLATVSFTALALGISPITASNVFLDFTSSGFTIANGAVLVTDGSTPVPEASSALLLTIGILLFWSLRQQRKANDVTEADL